MRQKPASLPPGTYDLIRSWGIGKALRYHLASALPSRDPDKARTLCRKEISYVSRTPNLQAEGLPICNHCADIYAEFQALQDRSR